MHDAVYNASIFTAFHGNGKANARHGNSRVVKYGKTLYKYITFTLSVKTLFDCLVQFLQ